MQLTENTKANIKSTYEIVRGLIFIVIVIVLGLAITTGTVDAKDDGMSVKPSEHREYGVRTIIIDKSFAVDKHCTQYYEDRVKFDACLKKTELEVDTKYLELDK